MAIYLDRTQMYNGDTNIEHRYLLSTPTVDEVILALSTSASSMTDPTVEIEYDPCPYGGFGYQYLLVSGKPK